MVIKERNDIDLLIKRLEVVLTVENPLIFLSKNTLLRKELSFTLALARKRKPGEFLSQSLLRLPTTTTSHSSSSQG